MTVADVLPIAVIGIGHLGTRHAERLSESPRMQVVALFDLDREKAGAVGDRLRIPAMHDLDEAIDAAEAVVVATATEAHAAVVERALRRGRHVLVEKPITGSPAAAANLARIAETEGRVLQVGLVERFNPAIRPLLGRLPRPLFVESHRLAPLVPRSLDIDVIQDLMIHDIDLTLAFVGEIPSTVEAAGVSVLTDRVDIANARLTFPGGATANLTASRVSLERTRKFRMFLRGAYVSADCAARAAQVYRLRPDPGGLLAEVVRRGEPVEMMRFLEHQTLGPEGDDPLSAEHEAFRRAVRGETSDGVSAEAALEALTVMTRIEEAIRTARAKAALP